MSAATTNYAFIRFFGISLLAVGCWNFYLLRLLHEWSGIDLVHIGIGIGGSFVVGALILLKARAIQHSASLEIRPDLESVRKTLNILFLVVLPLIVLGDVMAVSDFAAKYNLVPDGTISEQALVIRNTLIARIGSFVALAIYLAVGLRVRPG